MPLAYHSPSSAFEVGFNGYIEGDWLRRNFRWTAPSDSSTYAVYTHRGAVTESDRTLSGAAVIVNVLPTYGVAFERVPVRPDVLSYAILMSPLRSGDDLNCAWQR